VPPPKPRPSVRSCSCIGMCWDVKTTMVYTHVLNRGGRGCTEPGRFPWNRDWVGVLCGNHIRPTRSQSMRASHSREENCVKAGHGVLG